MERLNQDANTNKTDDPTANYRPYKKGPNFLLIVILACVAFLVILVAALLLLMRSKATRLDPHGPSATPNSLVRPTGPRLFPAIHDRLSQQA